MSILLLSESLKLELKAKLREKGIRQIEIAERLKIPQGNISRALSANYKISLDLFCQIAELAELEPKLD
jgi:transcriptional regulator with XRE-family HTH domain